MIIKSTDNVPLDIIRKLSRELELVLNVEVNGSQVSHRSSDLPSWIQFIAEADWWLQAFAAYSVIFVTELVKETAKASHAKLSSGVKATANKIWELSSKILDYKSYLPKETKIQLVTSIPNRNVSCNIEFTELNADDLAIKISLFIHYIPGIQKLFAAEELTQNKILGTIDLKVLDDLSLEVSWRDSTTLSMEKKILTLEIQ